MYFHGGQAWGKIYAYLSNTLTNLCIALYCILLYCVVLNYIVLLIYCYVDIYNTMLCINLSEYWTTLDICHERERRRHGTGILTVSICLYLHLENVILVTRTGIRKRNGNVSGIWEKEVGWEMGCIPSHPPPIPHHPFPFLRASVFQLDRDTASIKIRCFSISFENILPLL